MSVRDAMRWLVPTTTRTTVVNDFGGLLTQFKALMATRRYAPPARGQRPRVAIASFGAGANHLVVDCLLGHALQLRGAACQLLLCDLPDLPGCDERFVDASDNQR